MARSLETIYDSITSAFVADSVVKLLYGLDKNKTFAQQFSSVTIEAILMYRIAVAIWTLEQLFDLHKQEVTELINNKKVGSLRWYAYMAKQFQYGYNLDPDTDEYDNTGLTDEEIEASKIVAYSAVGKRGSTLLMKTAKLSGDDLAPLADDELAAFKEYVFRWQCAGDTIEYINQQADKLKLKLTVYYNPLVINKDGERLDGKSTTPVVDAIRQYLKELPFNGELVLAYLVDAMQAVEGIAIPHIDESYYQYGGINWELIDIKYQPLSGYFTIADADLDIEYLPYTDAA